MVSDLNIFCLDVWKWSKIAAQKKIICFFCWFCFTKHGGNSLPKQLETSGQRAYRLTFFLVFAFWMIFSIFFLIRFFEILGPPGNHASQWIRDLWSKGILLILAYFYTFLVFAFWMIFFRFSKISGFGVFLVHRTVVSVLLSASVKRCFVSRMQDFLLLLTKLGFTSLFFLRAVFYHMHLKKIVKIKIMKGEWCQNLQFCSETAICAPETHKPLTIHDKICGLYFTDNF